MATRNGNNDDGKDFEEATYELSNEDKKFVYEPAEDTNILLDALEMEWTLIRDLQPSICVEIGPGSGLVSCTLAKNLRNRCSVFAVDINPYAVEVTRRNARLNGIDDVHVIVGDLLTSLSDRMKGSIDLLIFNPPYVPTDGFGEVDEVGILARSWCGGDIDGTAVLRRILPEVFSLLSTRGIFYLVAIASNRIENLLQFDDRLIGNVIVERKHGLERLYVLKFVRRR